MVTRSLMLAVMLIGGIAASSQLDRHTFSSELAGSSAGVMPTAFQETSRMSMSEKTAAGAVADVAVSTEGTVWIAGRDGAVRFSKDGGDTWVAADNSGAKSQLDLTKLGRMSGFVRVSARTDKAVFAVRADGTLWKYDGRNWTQTPASGMGDVGISQTGTVWVAGKNGTVWFSRDEGATWTRVQASDFSSIAAGDDTQVWAVGSNQTLWKYNGQTQTWKKVRDNDGQTADVSVATNGGIWVAVDFREIFYSDNEGQTYNRTNPNDVFARIAVGGDNTVWAVRKSDWTLWKFVERSKSSPVTPTPTPTPDATTTCPCQARTTPCPCPTPDSTPIPRSERRRDQPAPTPTPGSSRKMRPNSLT